MARFEVLPREILGNIISIVSNDRLSLVHCALVCRSISPIANQFLYANVDLTMIEEYTEEPPTISMKRQITFLRSIAENPSLGAMVKNFKNGNLPGQESEDATWEAESSDMLSSIAQNMRNLSNADFTANSLAAKIITNIPSYQNLHHLTVNGIEPEQLIWDKFPTTLRSLKWAIPPTYARNESMGHPWDKVQFLINVVEFTCPDLESFDVDIASSNWRSRPGADLQQVAPHIVEQYRTSETSSPRLMNLHHFGFVHPYYGVEDMAQQHYTEFVQRYQQSLNSLTITVGDWSEKKTLDFVQGACKILPNLKDLALVQSAGFAFRADPAGRNYLPAFIRSLLSLASSIEKLSIDNIGVSFSLAQSELFEGLTNLKVLRVGDAENKDGPYGDDGRINVTDYRDQIWGFVRALPVSLEEVYLEINGESLIFDDDEDFNPLCDFAEDGGIFCHRLNTLDIQVWCSNLDGGIGFIPEKAVFYRRLPSTQVSGEAEEDTRDIWVSRMDCIYQEDHPIVVKQCELMELGPENFAGKDAEGQWCGGYEFEDVNDEVDRSWPGWKHEVESYPMFRKTW